MPKIALAQRAISKFYGVQPETPTTKGHSLSVDNFLSTSHFISPSLGRIFRKCNWFVFTYLQKLS